MSGVKETYVQLRSSEHARLMQGLRRQDDLDSALKAARRERDSVQQDLRRQQEAMERRGREFEQRLKGVSDEVRRVESGFNQKLAQQAQEFRQGMASLAQRLDTRLDQQREEYLDLIERQGRQFDTAMREQRRELEQQIGALATEIARKEGAKRERAGQWLADTRGLLDLIGREYRHDKFKPGALDRLRGELILAEGNVRAGDYEAAIGGIQRTFLEAQYLRQELEARELEWNAHLTMARRSAAEVLATCDAQDSCRFLLETEEGAEEVAGEVDFWTEGGLTRLRTEAAAEARRLDAAEPLTLEALKESIARSGQWREECLALAERAKEALIASQLRNNMAQTIIGTLEGAGWAVADSTYAGEDFRRAVHVRLEHLGGDEMVTVIAPEQAQGAIRNRLDVFFYDRTTNDEANRERRLTAITGHLEAEGLSCGRPQCAPGTERVAEPPREHLDLERVRRAPAGAGGSGGVGAR